jgi:tetratricopeptide (TPR) repeat protein
MVTASAGLFAAWQSAGAERRTVLAGLTPPGAIALRSRYRHLLDPETQPGPWDTALTWEQWQEIVLLEYEGDLAIRRGAAAGGIFARLLSLEPSSAHRVVTVHAHIGFADVARAGDDGETAATEYETALRAAEKDRYRFGSMRALVGLGYVTLRFHSASAALARFGEAAGLAAAVGDALYVGNCSLGIAECQERLGNLGGAVEGATAAYDSFAGMRSPLGEGNAAQRLGAVLHRMGRRDEARDWYEVARDAFIAAENPMGLTNTLSGLGDIALQESDIDGAERAYRQALDTAEAAGLPLSRAHGLQDIARVARSRGDWESAVRGFAEALAAYRALDDVLGMSNAFDKLAEALERLGEGTVALRVRVEAVFAVEEYRATHRDEKSQREYRDRFRRAYSLALAAATDDNAPESFAVVAECLAGRRLAGLFAESARNPGDTGLVPIGTGRLALLEELLVRADQRLVEHRRGDGPPLGDEGIARRKRVIQMLGAVGIKYGLAEQAEITLNDLLATVYLPPEDEGAGLLAALPAGCHVLQTLLDPLDSGVLRWLWRQPGGPVAVGVTELPEEAVALLGDGTGQSSSHLASSHLASSHLASSHLASSHLADLKPLAALLPTALRETLAAGNGHRLVVIPVGELWLAPWSAVPVSPDRVLGEAAIFTLCPSLTVQRQLATRGAPTRDVEAWQADFWRSPLIKNYELRGFQQDRAWQVNRLQTPAQARERLRSGGGDAMVVTAHGRPAPGLVHYLELDAGEWLLPVDLIGARPPRHLIMIACWGGAVPGHSPTDPLALATLALVAGSVEIMATVGELADSDIAEKYVEQVLAALPRMPLPEALNAATRWILADDGARAESSHHWAPLTAFGTLY